jgi:hypothetical protein
VISSLTPDEALESQILIGSKVLAAMEALGETEQVWTEAVNESTHLRHVMASWNCVQEMRFFEASLSAE